MFDPLPGARTTNCENIPGRDAPVQRVALPVRLQDDVLREPQDPVDQHPVHGPEQAP
jgi:hypothetical protein